VLRLHRPALERFGDLSAGNLRLIRIVQATPVLTELLDDLRQAWEPSVPIHADVRLDNVMVRAGRGIRQVRLVDWELAGLSGHAVLLAQVAANLAEAPDLAAVRLLGLGTPGPERVPAGILVHGDRAFRAGLP